MIRRKSQLCALVRLLEQSRPKTASDPHGLGWHVTHIKLLIVGAGHDEDRRSATERETARSAPEERYIEPEDDFTANLVKRLLICCPRLQVFLDAAPYAADEIPRSVLPSISNASMSLAGAEESSPSSFALLFNENDEGARPASQIRSLEWGYGSPSISDLLDPAHANVINSVRSLRCTAIADPNWIFSTVQGTLRRMPLMQQLPRALLALHEASQLETGSALLRLSRAPKSLREQPLLMFSQLISLDMFISARSHMHWPVLVSATTTSIAGSSLPITSTNSDTSSGTGLPSLTHLTMRTPSSLGTILGPEAIASLHVFLKAYGAQLKSLDLRISPGDVDPNARLPPPPPHIFQGMPMNPEFGAGVGNGNGNGNGAGSLLNIPLVLARCPNLEDFVLSARWPSPHSNDAVGANNAAVGPNQNNPQQQQQEAQNRPNPSPFAIPHHEKLRRIGFRDTAPWADGFSSSLANMPCPSCRRVHMLSSATDAGRGSGRSAGNGSASGELPYRPLTSSSNITASPSATSTPPRPSLLSLASALALPASSILAAQHPFPSTLIDSLLSGSLVGNAMHDATNNGLGSPMNHRHCTIDRHFRMILNGARVVGEPEPYLPPFVREARDERGSGAVADMLAAADRALFGDEVGIDGGVAAQGGGGGGTRRVPSQNEQDILRRRFGAMPRFPNLEAIQLLDSKPSMFSNAKPATAPSPSSTLSSMSPYSRSSLSLPLPLPHTNSVSGATTSCSTTCWCIPYESRVEMNFWGAWAARSESRGIKLLDRDGRCLNPVYAVPSSSSPSSTAHSSASAHPTSPVSPSSYSSSLSAYAPLPQLGVVKVENLDLEDELNVSIIRAALSGPSSAGLSISAPIRPFIDTYSAVSTLLSLTLRSKGPSDMTTREVVKRLVIWFAEHGIISMTSECASGFVSLI